MCGRLVTLLMLLNRSEVSMERESGKSLNLHSVRRVAEVGACAANDLLECGWILHDIQFDPHGEYCAKYVLLCMEEPRCPVCGAIAKIEVLDEGERVRYICNQECAL